MEAGKYAVSPSGSNGKRNRWGRERIILLQWHGREPYVQTRLWYPFLSAPSRYSYDMIKKTGEFVINLTTEKLAFATDYCGVRSGRDVDKFKEMNLTKEKAEFVSSSDD